MFQNVLSALAVLILWESYDGYTFSLLSTQSPLSLPKSCATMGMAFCRNSGPNADRQFATGHFLETGGIVGLAEPKRASFTILPDGTGDWLRMPPLAQLEKCPVVNQATATGARAK